MKFVSIAEILAVPSGVTRPAAPTQAPGPPARTFSQSLIAVSRASSDTTAALGDSIKSSRRQKSVSEDAKLPPTLAHNPAVPPPTPSSQILHPQAPTIQRLLLMDPVNPLPIQRELPPEASVASPHDLTTAPAAGPYAIESNLTRPVITQTDSVPPGNAQKADDSTQIKSILPLPTLQSTTDLPIPVSQTLTSLPDTGAVTDPRTVSTAPLDRVPKSFVRAIAIVPPLAVEKPLASPIPHSDPTAVTNKVQSSASSVLRDEILNGPLTASQIPPAHPAVNASFRENVAPASSAVSTSPTDPQAAPPSPPASGPSISSTTADQLTGLIQPDTGTHIINQAGEANSSAAKPFATTGVSDKDNVNGASSDTSGLKQHSAAPSDQPGTQKGSQDTSTTGDQSQASASPLQQTGAPSQMSSASHTLAVADHAGNQNITSPLQSAPTLAGVSGHTAKTPDAAAPAAPSLPQAAPVINTAKLIQSMGQSEMKVGIRSNDFGNISISTSATRDLISTQISLDHSELARTLAAHVPELQTRLGGKEAMDVRIDLNGQSAASSTGMSHGSAGESRSDRQQKGNAQSVHAANGFAEHGRSVPSAALPTGDSRLNARLDITA